MGSELSPSGSCLGESSSRFSSEVASSSGMLPQGWFASLSITAERKWASQSLLSRKPFRLENVGKHRETMELSGFLPCPCSFMLLLGEKRQFWFSKAREAGDSCRPYH